MKEYALYKGDELLAIGTIRGIAKKMGVKRETIAFYKTQAYKNRLKKLRASLDNRRILIPIDDGEEELGQEGLE